MDLDDATEKVGKVENLIEAIFGVLKRNWGKLIVIFCVACFGYFCYMGVDEIENEAIEEEYYEDDYEGYDEDPYQEYQEDIE